MDGCVKLGAGLNFGRPFLKVWHVGTAFKQPKLPVAIEAIKKQADDNLFFMRQDLLVFAEAKSTDFYNDCHYKVWQSERHRWW